MPSGDHRGAADSRPRPRARRVAVVLVSHYMEEIGRLADRVAVLDANPLTPTT